MIDWIWTQLEAGTLTPQQARELWALYEAPWYMSAEGMIAVMTAAASAAVGLLEWRVRSEAKKIHATRDIKYEEK